MRRTLKTAVERNIRALELRPSLGRGTAVTTVRVRGDETLCNIEDGPWTLAADLGKGEGGGGEAPDPGVYLRSALGSCLALGYLMWAARMDVAVDDVSVRIETDYDACGEYGVSDAAPRYQAVRCIVMVSSPEPEERVRAMIEAADRHSPILDDLTRGVPMTRQIEITSGSEVR